jgi:hypothetical protein
MTKLTRPANMLLSETKKIVNFLYTPSGYKLSETEFTLSSFSKVESNDFIIYQEKDLNNASARQRIPIFAEIRSFGNFLYSDNKDLLKNDCDDNMKLLSLIKDFTGNDNFYFSSENAKRAVQ